MSQENKRSNADLLNRREILKGLATVPVLGFFFIKLWQKLRLDKLKKLNDELLKEESTDEKDDKVSANPDSNNVHG